MYRTFFIVAHLFCISMFVGLSPANAQLDTVHTDAGLLAGITNQKGDIHIFKGIPFAAPPVGELRWKAPQAVRSWTGVRMADHFGPSPMQQKPAPFSMWSEEFLIPEEPISEDCLYLNVWTGVSSSAEKRPVLVWIYGGGFMSGGSAVPIYDGEAMARKGIVFVSINYRVGIFGFFAHPALSKASGRNASGNYGLMDQIAALQWVQRNIAAFGGDPDNVTIAGQSAGSMSVNCLLASPLAKNLFHKAIAQSGASFANRNPGLQQAERAGEKLMQSLQISSITALRQLPAEKLLQHTPEMRGPIIDGYVLPDAIVDIFRAGKQNHAALLTGWNEDEGLLFGPVMNAHDFRQQIRKDYSAVADTLLQYYPTANDSMAAVSQLKLSRDLIFGTQNYAWANMQSQHKNTPVYVYRFTRIVPATGKYLQYGAFHTGEVPYAYDNLKFVNRPWENADHELAHTMSSYWANFVKTGNPNGEKLPFWPAYNRQEKKIMMLDKTSKAQTLPDEEALDLLLKQMHAH